MNQSGFTEAGEVPRELRFDRRMGAAVPPDQLRKPTGGRRGNFVDSDSFIRELHSMLPEETRRMLVAKLEALNALPAPARARAWTNIVTAGIGLKF